MRRSVAVVAGVALLATAVFGVGLVAAGGSGYSLSIDGSTDIPEQTVTVDGSEYTFDAIAAREPGEELVVHATVPDEDDEYNVDLRNSDNEPVQSRPMTGSGETTLSTDRDPGTYVVILRDDGFRAIHPLVIAGYEVTSFHVPDEIEAGSTATATVELEDRESMGEPHAVEVVIGDEAGDDVLRVAADAVGQSTYGADYKYEAEIDGDDLPAGEYSAYAVVQTDEEIEGGENEIVGISGRRSVSFTGSDGGSGAGAGGDGGGTSDGSEAGDDGGDEDSSTTDDGEDDGTATPTPNGTDDSTTSDGTDDSTTPDGSTTDDQSGTATPGDDDAMITPGGDDDDGGSDADGAGPPVGVVVAVFALGGLLWRRMDG